MSPEDDHTQTVSVVHIDGGPLPEELPPKTIVGEYVIEGSLGVGGCARVYSARQPVIERRVAIKVLHKELAGSAQMIQRFIREARIVNKVRHPALVDIYTFGMLPDGRPYFVMEFLPGRNLGALLQATGRLSPPEALEYLEPVVSALTAVHALGVVHRDIKPGNVMITQEGSPPKVKLLDFGIAKLLHPEAGETPLTTDQQRLGSHQSMAPEQILGGDVDQRTDVYALGILLFAMLTGKSPFFRRDPLAIQYAHLNQPPPLPSSYAPLSPAIDQVVLKALAKAPAGRYQTAAELFDALREAVGPVVSGQKPREPVVNREARALGLAVVLKAVGGREDDEALLERAAAALEPIDASLTTGGFRVLLQTSDTMVAAQLLSDDPKERSAQALKARELSEHIYNQVKQLAGEGLQCVVLVHVDDVELKLTTNGATPVGGKLVRFDDWPLAATEGWYATRDVLELTQVK